MKKLLILCGIALSYSAWAQPGELIDKIVAGVGNEIILHSDVEAAALEMSQGKGMNATEKCALLENILFQKLLLNQAKLDSMVVTESQVEAQIEQRLNYFIGMFGSTEEFENYYGKSISEWKVDFHDDIRDQLLVQQERQKLVENVSVTPKEVIDFFEEIPADSLPLISAEVEYSQLVIKPTVRTSEHERVRNFIDSVRTEVVSGKSSMFLQAAKWSEDPGSKNKGGCYELQRKGSFVPEYEAAVYNTPEGSYSPVFESEFGYHFVKVVEKRGDYYESCHILMAPKINAGDLSNAKAKLDSIAAQIQNNTLSFESAALSFSTDKNSSNQEGRVINTNSGGTKHAVGELAPNIFFVLDKLKPGEVSEPVITDNADGTQAYVLYKLTSRTEAHRANLDDDYLIFKNQAEQDVQLKVMEKWIAKTLKNTYTWVDDDHRSCTFDHAWLRNPQ